MRIDKKMPDKLITLDSSYIYALLSICSVTKCHKVSKYLHVYWKTRSKRRSEREDTSPFKNTRCIAGDLRSPVNRHSFGPVPGWLSGEGMAFEISGARIGPLRSGEGGPSARHHRKCRGGDPEKRTNTDSGAFEGICGDRARRGGDRANNKNRNMVSGSPQRGDGRPYSGRFIQTASWARLLTRDNTRAEAIPVYVGV